MLNPELRDTCAFYIAFGSWAQASFKTEGVGQALMESKLLRVRWGASAEGNFGIVELRNKQTGTDMAGNQLNMTWLSYGNGPGTLASAQITRSGVDHVSMLLEWSEGVLQQFTLHRESLAIRIDYFKYGVNIVDIGLPGGAEHGVYVIHGADRWKRGYVGYPKSYYNAPEDNDGPKVDDLSYKGHFILGLINPKNGEGFGRVASAATVDIVKLLFPDSQKARGFELFPFFGRQRKAMSQYLFLAEGGAPAIMEQGKSLVDQANWSVADPLRGAS